EARLEEELLRERVAHLHRRPLLLAGRVERGRGEEARAVDAVAAGARADVDDGVADPRGARPEEAIGRRDAEREGVHQDVVVVARVEGDLAAHGGDANRIAIVPNAGHHTLHQVGRPGAVHAAEGARALVRAWLGPQAGEHAELLEGGGAPEQRHDPPPLLPREAVLVRDLGADRAAHPGADAAGPAAALRATQASTERKRRSPSAPPVRCSTACSGCGMSPTTGRSALHKPAMRCSEPLGFASGGGRPARSGGWRRTRGRSTAYGG